MASRVVQGQDGRRWRVKRRWAPRLGTERLWDRLWRRMSRGSRATRSVLNDAAETADPGCLLDDVGVALVAFVVVGVLVLLLTFVVVPLLVALVDLVVLLILVVGGIVARVVLRRPWIVEARSNDGLVHRWKVVGLRASAERRDEIASLLAAGVVPPDGDVTGTPRA